MKSLSHVRPSATPWTAAYKAPPSMRFSRQEYCSGVPITTVHQMLFSLVQSLSRVGHLVQSPMVCSMPGLPVHDQFPELAQTHVHRVGDAIQPSCPLSSPLPPDFNLYQLQGLFQEESALHTLRPKHWSFSFSFSPFNEYSGLISLRIDWLDLLAVQGTLRSLLKHQFESISPLALSLIYGLTLISVHEYWENHSFDYMEIFSQIDVSGF